MANYLVDTSILIDVFRNHAPARKWIDTHKIGELTISFVTVAELSAGCRNKREQLAVAKDLIDYQVLWASDAVQQQALKWLQQFRLSDGIGFLDCLIAATAVANGLSLATINDKHFSIIPGLVVNRPY